VKRLTRTQIDRLKPYWKQKEQCTDKYFASLCKIETSMSKELGIKGMEFVWCDNYICGIGDEDRTIKLVPDHQLEIR